MAVSPLPAGAQNTCAGQFEKIVTVKARFISLQKLRTAPKEEREEFFRRLVNRANRLRNYAQSAALRDDEAGIAAYQAIGAQVPHEGYVRALSVEEVRNIVSDGKMGSFYDFGFRNDGARVGHGGNFIFVRCKSCAADAFQDGALGSSMVNRRPLELEELELVIPELPITAAPAK